MKTKEVKGENEFSKLQEEMLSAETLNFTELSEVKGGDGGTPVVGCFVVFSGGCKA